MTAFARVDRKTFVFRPHGLVLAAWVLLTVGTAVAATPGKPNIVFIMADDLGYGDLSCFGQTHFKTPNIDRLAAEGVTFPQFYAGSTVCAPSRCVLLTGLHTGHARIRGNANVDLRPEDVTAAEVLKNAGYATGLFGKWGLGSEGSPGVPNQQGFEEFFGYLDQTHAHNYYPTFLMKNGKRVALRNVVPNERPSGSGKSSNKLDYSPNLIADAALDFIDRHRGGPFFLYFASTLPHANNEAAPEGMEIPDLGEFENKDWPAPQKGTAAMIAKLDADVGRLVAKLDEHGLTENTIIFFTSDNGPHSEGGNRAEFFNSNGPLRGIKRAMYEGGIRVPTIVRWPGRAPAGVKSEYIGYFADFLPTAAALAGVEAPSGLDGISFLPAILGQPDQPAHEFLYWEFYEGRSAQAVRFGDWKAVISPLGSENVELYNLADDLGETHNLAAERPDLVAQAREIAGREHVPSPLWVKPEDRPQGNRRGANR